MPIVHIWCQCRRTRTHGLQISERQSWAQNSETLLRLQYLQCCDSIVPCSSPPPATTDHSIPSICGLVANRSPLLLKYSLKKCSSSKTPCLQKIAFLQFNVFSHHSSGLLVSCFKMAVTSNDSFFFNISRLILFSQSSYTPHMHIVYL